MKPMARVPLCVNDEEFAILNELLESERIKLLASIRHAGDGPFRDKLRRRLALVEGLVEMCGAVAISAAE